MADKAVSVFIHIPKTGGTTLNEIFKRQYNSKKFHDHDSYNGEIKTLDELNEHEKNKILAVAGHHFYGDHEYFNKPFRYFTMLRNPVDRVISLYYFLQTFPGYERVKDMSLEEYILAEPEAQNNQTVLICGDFVNPDLDTAKERLKTFQIVGVTDMFDESLFFLKKEFNWKKVNYTKKNITKNRPLKEEISSDLINLIKEYNALDIELYYFAKQLLEEKINNLDSKEKVQLASFIKRQANFSKRNSL
ncbi:sulfotransferase family 2 domain-containing protein [Niallia sp. 03133]|uniref:sulfotransferase family 2 domain-containing protein n=1 Tax=Niallia sp. 03133 TaxID=3458060 RepID=UPI004044A97B